MIWNSCLRFDMFVIISHQLVVDQYLINWTSSFHLNHGFHLSHKSMVILLSVNKTMISWRILWCAWQTALSLDPLSIILTSSLQSKLWHLIKVTVLDESNEWFLCCHIFSHDKPWICPLNKFKISDKLDMYMSISICYNIKRISVTENWCMKIVFLFINKHQK